MRSLAVIAAVSAALAASGVRADDRDHGVNLRTRLIGFQEVPAVSTDARGAFRAQINEAKTAIDYELTYSGLQATVTQAHIHFGQLSVIGSIVIWLCGTPTNPGPVGTQVCPQSGTIAGTITAANVIAASNASQQIVAGELDEVIRAIRAGVAYVNVHTQVSPGGEIRGQLRAGERDD